MTIEGIASAIKRNAQPGHLTLIGVEGFGGSGKTTFADQLKNILGDAYVVGIDDFIVKEKLAEPSWDKGAFDRDRLERQVLKPAKDDAHIQYEELLWESNTLSSPKTVPKVSYLIIEGISCYHPNIAHYYDYKIWIDTPIEVANERGHARDGSNKNAHYWDLWTENDIKYQEKYHPEKVADFVYNNAAENREEKLVYGLVSSPVKVNNTVRRQTGPWTPTIHALLHYLHENNFTYSPIVEGFDDKGREILTFIPGEAAVRPWPNAILDMYGVEQAGRMLRTYHDIVAGFVPDDGAEWRIGKCELKPGQIIRHGDLGPWNTIWQGDKLAALIDWDFAQPGERIDDLAQMAYYFVPLRGEKGWVEAGFDERPDVAQRLKSLVKSYGMFSTQEVLKALLDLLEADREIIKKFGNDGIEPWVSFLKREDIEESVNDSKWLQDVKRQLLA